MPKDNHISLPLQIAPFEAEVHRLVQTRHSSSPNHAVTDCNLAVNCHRWLGGVLENPDRHRCLGATGQWRGAHAQDHGTRTHRHGPRGPFLTPLEFRTLPCPPIRKYACRCSRSAASNGASASSIPTCCTSRRKGRSALAARRFALRNDFPFTTAYHTRFPEYVHARLRLPLSWSYAWLRRFHGAVEGRDGAHAGGGRRPRRANGFKNVKLWSRGVDARHFPSAAEQAPEQHAADLPVRRAGGRGEERRSVPRARPAGLEVGGGHGPRASRGSARAFPGELSRAAGPRRAREGVRRRRRVRVPEQDRHLWPRVARGHGLRACRWPRIP